MKLRRTSFPRCATTTRPSAATDWRECIEEIARSLKVSINACFEAVIDREIYAYLSATEDGVAIARRIEPMVAERLGDPTASALSQLLRVPGPAYGLSAPFHYVVETDVEPEHEAELNAWYNTEHLPGLSSVPGNVRSTRYLSAAGRSFACYDLVSEDVPQTPEWMQWRETALTLSVRQYYKDMKRGLYRAA